MCITAQNSNIKVACVPQAVNKIISKITISVFVEQNHDLKPKMA